MKGIESPVPLERIQQAILLIRGKRVMLDANLAKLYGVSTKRLNEQVKRNRDRFPQDFMFQLNPEEAEVLRSQIATSKEGRGGRRYLPFAFPRKARRLWKTITFAKNGVWKVKVFASPQTMYPPHYRG